MSASGVQAVIAETLYIFTSVLKFLVFARVLLSWFPRFHSGGGVIGKVSAVILAMTEPIMGPLRRIIAASPISGVSSVMDFSPILAYFLIDGCAAILISVLITV